MSLGIYVKTLFGDDHFTTVTSNCTVNDTKCQVAQTLGIDVTLFDLCYEGKILPSSSKIMASGIVGESMIEMTRSKKGAALQRLESEKISPTVENMIKNIESQQGNLVECFLDAGVSADSSFDKFTPLMTCYKEGISTLKIAELLLMRGAVVGDAIFLLMQTRASEGFLDLLELLVQYGANLDATDKNGDTPLQHAIANDNKEAVAELVRRGVNVDKQNSSETSPLHNAVTVVSASFESEISTELVELLINAGCDLNLANSTGFTPLHDAIILNSKEITQLLIKRGASTSIKTAAGHDAVSHAKFYNPRMVRVCQGALA
eukprot:TRINITY_DN4915_c0_g1_i1.p1 TRINITY_DN4915_c0_g1~~TRINITY_DN4915_c0_g1_i1.p1  ORF type:complete len:319 (+),score=46.74 TRINITY_DN4915_c0_g1_i1:82-1038(+)